MAPTAWLTVSTGEALCARAAIGMASVTSMKLPHRKKRFMKLPPEGARRMVAQTFARDSVAIPDKLAT